MGKITAAVAALSMLAGATSAWSQESFRSFRGDRSGGWLAQSRSEVVARNGMVATSQPLAAQAGLEILKKGGNAFDAAVAAAAVLNVVEPGGAGIGGDMFAIAWIAKEKKLVGLNGTGRAVTGSTPDYFASRNIKEIDWRSIDSVSVPGAVDGWDALLKRGGTMTFKQVLEPAVRIADEGFAVSERIHYDWEGNVDDLRKDPDSAKAYLVNGEAPAAYSIFRNPDLAKAFRALQSKGRDAFYKGEIARAIVAKSQALGGRMTMDDLARTQATWVNPISTNYKGFDVYELPPSTQGFATLEMLNIVEVCAPQLGVDLAKLGHSSPLYWHFLIEAKKIAYADLHRYNADPDFANVPVDRLISKAYAGTRCKDISLTRAAPTPAAAEPMGGTVYISAADKDGNMVSLIYSVFEGFGSAITVPGYGFVLNDRANLFSLDPTSPNAIAPGKRPFQTLIPGFVMKDGEPLMSFGLMGGIQQAQGHAQVLINMIDLGANVQAASDAARFSHFQDRNTVWLEAELFRNVGGALSAMGHRVVQRDGTEMGGYQAIMRTLGRTAAQGQIYRGGSDHRKDGQAVGW
ncbi:gamma-glutamyltransferase [Phenylobacterium sp.]|jgi:gamma-glutamyltranspeptidase/glutathione hydrolase|uniref:gamma-glutamyltransferase n=1 Tax=Phenylobacterium sp. TaxID=1871053 RepID=UPI003783E171